MRSLSDVSRKHSGKKTFVDDSSTHDIVYTFSYEYYGTYVCKHLPRPAGLFYVRAVRHVIGVFLTKHKPRTQRDFVLTQTTMKIIIKIGTKVLSREDGTLDTDFLSRMVDQIVELRLIGTQVVLVTSGAVGAGKSLTKLRDESSETVRKQVFAAIGQVKLMTVYAELFARHGYHCAQVLATKEDFRDDKHYLNMQNCFEALLLDNVIPIVNENDVVATTELMFTDNDELAGLVAKQLKADRLIILTGTDGILDAGGKTVHIVDAGNIEEVSGYISPDKSAGGRGGMKSKFAVAEELSLQCITVRIVDGRGWNILDELTDRPQTGTTFITRSK